jgi:hypothetical protein
MNVPDTLEATHPTAVATSMPPIGVAAFSADRTLTLSNRRFGELLGLDKAQLTEGMPFDALITALGQAGFCGCADANAFLAALGAADRRVAFTLRRTRRSGVPTCWPRSWTTCRMASASTAPTAG